MPSVKVREQPDGIRELTKVTSLPKDVKVSQVSFTRKRMFVVTTDGSLYSFRIVEQERKHDMFSSRMASWTGKLLID